MLKLLAIPLLLITLGCEKPICNGTYGVKQQKIPVHIVLDKYSLTKKQQEDIRKAIDKWNNALPFHLLEEAEEGSSITMGMLPFNTNATTYVKYNTDVIVKGDIVINVHNTADLELVMLHEFGHLLGLSHNGDKDSVMYPFSSGPKAELDNKTKEAIECLYGQDPFLYKEY